MSHIAQLRVQGSEFSQYVIGNGNGLLGPLNRINLFVGANNSGKSRLVRNCIGRKNLQFEPTVGFEEFRAISEELKFSIESVVKANRLAGVNDWNERAQLLPTFSEITEGEDLFKPLRELLVEILKATQINVRTSPERGSSGPHDQYRLPLVGRAKELLSRFEKAEKGFGKTITFTKVYIPTLRSLRPLNTAASNDLLEERTRKDYGGELNDTKIFTGQNLYHELQELLLGDLEKRASVKRFQEFLSSAFFDGQEIALIPRWKEDVLYVKIGREVELPIHQLGDGIQSIIALMFPVFKSGSENLLLAIEEPELFLHPGMQRVFVSTMLRKEFRNVQCFIATHSNHLLDLTLDYDNISVFTCRKEFEESDAPEIKANKIVENVSNRSERALELLGIQNSCVFLSNCTIWVEGITDRRYISAYLQLYKMHLEETSGGPVGFYKQDLHFSFVEYGGSNITHWSFLDDTDDAIVVDRLCGRLFLIADQDGAAGKKAARQEKLKEKLGERFLLLQCREIENLISPSVLLKVVQEYEGEAFAIPLPKHDHYRAEPLGRYIEETLLSGKRKRVGSYKTESGTISDKVEFCRRVLKYTTTFQSLSDQTKDLVCKLYKFIGDHNKS